MAQEQVQELNEGKIHAMEFLKRLREESVNKSDPLPEWTTPKLCVSEFLDTAGCYCICKKKIYNVYEIFNINTNKRLEIGSDCAERWFKAKYICEQCRAPLGNVKKRMAEKNFICPKCARVIRKRQELEDKINRFIASNPPPKNRVITPEKPKTSAATSSVEDENEEEDDSISETSSVNSCSFWGREDYLRCKRENDMKDNWKISKYTFATAPDSFYQWALRIPERERGKNIVTYLAYKKEIMVLAKYYSMGDWR